MAPTTLLAGIGLAALTGLVYFAVGGLVMRRSQRVEEKGVVRAFALWWFALGAFTLTTVARDLLAVLGLLTNDIVEASIHLSIPSLLLGLWGLFYYLGYIFVGRRRLLVPSIVLYGALYVGFVYLGSTLEPVGVEMRTWNVEVDYADELTPALNMALLTALLLPIVLGVLAYASLAIRVQAAEQKFRIGMVSIAFLVWFGGSMIAGIVGLTQIDWWSLAARILGLTSSLLVAVAYAPPLLVRRLLSRQTRLVESMTRGGGHG